MDLYALLLRRIPDLPSLEENTCLRSDKTPGFVNGVDPTSELGLIAQRTDPVIGGHGA
jgi:hypothetical protein